MGTLSRDTLLAAARAKELPREVVELPELGGRVWVRALTGKERDEWELSNIVMRRGRAQPKLDNVRARLVVRCLVDDDGARLFTDADADALGDLRSDVLAKLYEVAQRLSKVTEEDLNELKNASGQADGSAFGTSLP